jgi:hypothetical protein
MYKVLGFNSRPDPPNTMTTMNNVFNELKKRGGMVGRILQTERVDEDKR